MVSETKGRTIESAAFGSETVILSRFVVSEGTSCRSGAEVSAAAVVFSAVISAKTATVPGAAVFDALAEAASASVFPVFFCCAEEVPVAAAADAGDVRSLSERKAAPKSLVSRSFLFAVLRASITAEPVEACAAAPDDCAVPVCAAAAGAAETFCV